MQESERFLMLSIPSKPTNRLTIPFAVEFMTNYIAKDEGHGAIFVQRLAPLCRHGQTANGDHVDRQLSLFEGIVAGVSHTEKSLLSTFHLIGGVEMQFLLSCNNMSIKQHLTCPKEKRLSSITGFHNDIIASGSYTDMNEMSKDDLELLSDALGGLTRKQINNVLCMSLVSERGLSMNYCLTEKQKLVEQAGF